MQPIPKWMRDMGVTHRAIQKYQRDVIVLRVVALALVFSIWQEWFNR